MKVYKKRGAFERVVLRRKDFKVEEKLDGGIAKRRLEFAYPLEDGKIYCEDLIEYGGELYRVKESPMRGDVGTVSAEQDVDALRGNPVRQFVQEGKNVVQCVEAAIAGSGWRCENVSAGTGEVRSFEEHNTDSMKLLEKIAEAFWVEMELSAMNRTVRLQERMGKQGHVRLVEGFNLKSLEVRADTNEFYTRIYPYGKDGLTVKSVNQGREYLDDRRYSDEVRSVIWEDGNYTDAWQLMQAAGRRLGELAAPKYTYTAQVRDMASMLDGYEDFAFGLGDDVDLTYSDLEVDCRQRIVHLVRYPDKPERNTLELSNRTVSFSDMQKKLLAAADCVGHVSSGNMIQISKVSGASELVVKESGKGLSSNDYTTEDRVKLSGIEAGARANVQADWNEANPASDAYIRNKPGMAQALYSSAAGIYADGVNAERYVAVSGLSGWLEVRMFVEVGDANRGFYTFTRDKNVCHVSGYANASFYGCMRVTCDFGGSRVGVYVQTMNGWAASLMRVTRIEGVRRDG